MGQRTRSTQDKHAGEAKPRGQAWPAQRPPRRPLPWASWSLGSLGCRRGSPVGREGREESFPRRHPPRGPAGPGGRWAGGSPIPGAGVQHQLPVPPSISL